jgi:hypothetical protein
MEIRDETGIEFKFKLDNFLCHLFFIFCCHGPYEMGGACGAHGGGKGCLHFGWEA